MNVAGLLTLKMDIKGGTSTWCSLAKATKSKGSVSVYLAFIDPATPYFYIQCQFWLSSD